MEAPVTTEVVIPIGDDFAKIREDLGDGMYLKCACYCQCPCQRPKPSTCACKCRFVPVGYNNEFAVRN